MGVGQNMWVKGVPDSLVGVLGATPLTERRTNSEFGIEEKIYCVNFYCLKLQTIKFLDCNKAIAQSRISNPCPRSYASRAKLWVKGVPDSLVGVLGATPLTKRCKGVGGNAPNKDRGRLLVRVVPAVADFHFNAEWNSKRYGIFHIFTKKLCDLFRIFSF